MEKQEAENKIKEIAWKIAEEYQPEKIILFGSYAWGNPGPDSDADLFIIKKSDERRIDRERKVQRLLFGRKFPVDILVYTPDEINKRLEIEDSFMEDIISRGKVLYSYDKSKNKV